MNILKLTLNKKWFDLVNSGVKTEEYREIKKHWIQRLVTNRFTAKDYKNENDVISLILDNKDHYSKHRMMPFHYVEFTNGYSKNSATILCEFKGMEITTGNPEWGAVKGQNYFVIRIGSIVQRTNCC